MKNLTGITALLLILSVSLHGHPVDKRPFDDEILKLHEKFSNITWTATVQLYTPEEVQEDCLRNALECFRKGLDTLNKECKEDLEKHPDTIDALVEFLNEAAENNGPMETSKTTNRCVCEAYRRMPLQNFTSQLGFMIKRVNSQS
ncbi:hypothetical protein SKAU_G00031450 [Synaphobranchus kaupii]|uniref:Interleukin n=1 Tax=Synaphobranchus kaupii TaxID=118154 RepID=A0A9Q1GFQ5_SYNKA|nr:hypothetical protein SKAU_G00031450 [Synaphobranchus kaupii]